MNITLEPCPAYFVHVPKTGGSTLGELLEDAYLPWQRIRLHEPNMSRLRLERLGDFRLYHAMHQGRTLLEMTGRRDLVCFTMLRDPVERACSQIRYLQRVVRDIPHTFTPEYLAEMSPMVDATLEECIDHPAFRKACGTQIRTLGVLEDYRPLFAGSPDVESGRSVLRPYPLPPLMDVDDQTLLFENAVRWLDSMAVVGLTEHYHESVLMICDRLGIPSPRSLSRVNVNPDRGAGPSNYRQSLSPLVLGKFEEVTATDRRVYEHAVERFKEQWSRHRARPRRHYSVGAHARHLVLGPVRPLVKKARLLARRMRRRLQGAGGGRG